MSLPVGHPETMLPRNHLFGNRDYVIEPLILDDLGKSKRIAYYADREALINVRKAISLLEFIEEQNTLDNREAPPLKGDLRKLDFVTESSKHEKLSSTPFLVFRDQTPTGRSPKFPTSVRFSGWSPDEDTWTTLSGCIDFFENGDIGKARLTYFTPGNVTYEAWFKVIGDGISLSSLKKFSQFGFSTVIYRYPDRAAEVAPDGRAVAYASPDGWRA